MVQEQDDDTAPSSPGRSLRAWGDDPQVAAAKINRSGTIAAAAITAVVGLAGVVITAAVTYQVGYQHGSQAANPMETSAHPTTATTTATAVSAPPTHTPSFWQGSVDISYTGLDFDLNPPGPGHDTVYAFIVSGMELNTRVDDGTDPGILVARYDGSTPPTQRQCHDWAESHAASLVDKVNSGDRICLVTPKNTTAFISVTGVDMAQESVSGTATVWGG